MLLIIIFLTFSTFYTQVKAEECDNITKEEGESVMLILKVNDTSEQKKIIFTRNGDDSMLAYFANGTITTNRTNLFFNNSDNIFTITNLTQADEGRYSVPDSDTVCKNVEIQKEVTTTVTEETTIVTKVTTLETKVTRRKTEIPTKRIDAISTPNEVTNDISVWVIGLGSALCVASISVCFLIFYLCRKYMYDGKDSKSRRIERILKYRRRQRHLQHNIDRENNIPEDDTDIFEAIIFPPAPAKIPRRERLISLDVVTEHEIVYAELDLYTPANGQIHGRGRGTEVLYSDIDLSRTVPSPCIRSS